MNLIQEITQYNINYTYFTKKVENTVLKDSYFSKVIYSNDKLMLNGIYFLIHLTNYNIEKYDNKQKCLFDIKSNKNIIDNLISIENMILNKYSNNKIKKYTMKEQLEKKHIRLYNDNYNKKKIEQNKIILKISGIWENNEEVGITFKFLQI
tara:strand:+ start:765 stop:1217 length:453 start_codon:yes stop_codon:yes gene_type:complete